MKIYVNPNDFKCCASRSDETYMEIDTDFFDGKCQTLIEGYRIVPSGYSWTRSDGTVFHGEMIAPFKPYDQLAAAQAQYEADMAEAADAYQEGVDSV